MAKFAIALCILLLACNALADTETNQKNADEWTKTEDALADESLQEIEDDSSGIIRRSNLKLIEVEKDTDEAIQAASNTEEKIWSDLQEIIDEHNANINEIISTNENVGQCITSSIDIEQLARNIVLDSMACVDNKLADLKAKRLNIVDAFEDFKSSVNDLVSNARDCPIDRRSRLTCVRDFLRTLTRETIPRFDALYRAANAYSNAVSSFVNNLWDVCYVESAKTTLRNQAKESLIHITQCIADLVSDRTA